MVLAMELIKKDLAESLCTKCNGWAAAGAEKFV